LLENKAGGFDLAGYIVLRGPRLEWVFPLCAVLSLNGGVLGLVQDGGRGVLSPGRMEKVGELGTVRGGPAGRLGKPFQLGADVTGRRRHGAEELNEAAPRLSQNGTPATQGRG
jgi:hypothetical protein